MRLLASLLALLALTGIDPAPRGSAPAMPVIAITAAPGAWTATYAFAQPTRRMVFDRSPDTSRTKTWTPAPGFEIVQGTDGEEVRRLDGRPFVSVGLRMAPAYRHLPKDYAPFSPFGDGAMLFHSGRFFACPDRCPTGARWRMSLAAPGSARIILDGAVRRNQAAWRDGGEGRSVYIGSQPLTVSGNLVAVIDATLPDLIRRQLDSDLPRYMRYFAARTAPLKQPPMLFVSFDPRYDQGWGRQGGTFPGQVFVHFFGPGWQQRMATPDFGFDLSWHLAHESGHLYQRGAEEPGNGSAWVHEGSAEAGAAIALSQLVPAYAAQVAAKVTAARAACVAATRDRSLEAVIAGGNFEPAYSCGLMLNLMLDHAVRAARPGSDGVFAVWRAYVGRDGRRLERYVDAVRRVAGQCVADALMASATTPGGATGEGMAVCGTTAPMASARRV